MTRRAAVRTVVCGFLVASVVGVFAPSVDTASARPQVDHQAYNAHAPASFNNLSWETVFRTGFR